MALFFAIYVYQIKIWCIFIMEHYASMVYAVVVCPSVWCGCSVPYLQLSDWTRLQWALNIQQTQWARPFSAVRYAMWLFPNDFVEDLSLLLLQLLNGSGCVISRHLVHQQSPMNFFNWDPVTKCCATGGAVSVIINKTLPVRISMLLTWLSVASALNSCLTAALRSVMASISRMVTCETGVDGYGFCDELTSPATHAHRQSLILMKNTGPPQKNSESTSAKTGAKSRMHRNGTV